MANHQFLIFLILVFSIQQVICVDKLLCSSDKDYYSDFAIVDTIHKINYIEPNLYCQLVIGQRARFKLRDGIIKALKYISRKSNGDCYGSDFTTSDVRMQEYVDSRIDFPNLDVHLSDTLRARVLRCVNISKFESVGPSKDIYGSNFHLDIVRNTIDHFAGFTKADIRDKYFRIKVLDIDLDYFTPMYSDSRLYLNSSNIKIPRDYLEDGESRNLQIPVTDVVATAFLGAMELNLGLIATAQSTTSVSNAFIASTVISISSLMVSVTSVILANIKKSDQHESIVEERLLNIEKNQLESRRVFLMQMENMIKEQRATNSWLKRISGQMEEVIFILDKIREELEEINSKLDDINARYDEVHSTDKNNTGILEVTYPELGDPDLPVSTLSDPLIDIYDGLLDDFKRMKCDSFIDIKLLYQEIAFMIFYLRIKEGRVTKEEYLDCRFNSQYKLSLDDNQFSCKIGGRHPKFTIREREINDQLESWSKGKSDETIKRAYQDMSLLFKMLEYRMIQSFKMYEIINFYNDAYISDLDIDRNYYDYIIKYESMEDLCMSY